MKKYLLLVLLLIGCSGKDVSIFDPNGGNNGGNNPPALAAPTLTNPLVSPHYTNLNNLSVQGTCINGVTVNLTGEVIASEVSGNSLTQVCSAGVFNFSITKTSDNDYDMAVFQSNSETSSTSVNFTITRDTLAPAAPNVTSPTDDPYVSAGPLVITGSCEINTTIDMTGDDTQSVLCADGSFSFSLDEALDNSYSYDLKAIDGAGNVSPSKIVNWTRLSSLPPAPLITSATVLLNNLDQNIITGTCITGGTVSISGEILASDVVTPLGSLSQTCVGGNFSFSVEKLVDDTFDYSLKQTVATVDSATSGVRITRDTIAPTTSIIANPGALLLLNQSALFSFSSNEANVTYECRLNAGAIHACNQTTSYTGGVLGFFTLQVRAKDQAGNVDATPSSHSWTVLLGLF